MEALAAIGLFIVGYIALVGRSAWKQGELRQFLLSLAVVIALIAAVAGVVAVYFLTFGSGTR